jgi:hypothetical protein
MVEAAFGTSEHPNRSGIRSPVGHRLRAPVDSVRWGWQHKGQDRAVTPAEGK